MPEVPFCILGIKLSLCIESDSARSVGAVEGGKERGWEGEKVRRWEKTGLS
jgi:hypothetical protein